MNVLTRWNPLQEVMDMRRAMDQIMQRSSGPSPKKPSGHPPALQPGSPSRSGTWSLARTVPSRRRRNGSWPSARARKRLRSVPHMCRTSPSPTPSPKSSCRLLSRSTEPVRNRDLGRQVARGDLPHHSGDRWLKVRLNLIPARGGTAGQGKLFGGKQDLR